MTLDERIAKRKADGWTLSHWVVKRFDGLYASSCAWTSIRNAAHPFFSEIDAREKVHVGLGARPVPVFTRTIKVSRGHGFGWALARMKEWKRVRRASWENPRDSFEMVSSGEIVGRHLVAYAVVDVAHILATNWELAE